MTLQDNLERVQRHLQYSVARCRRYEAALREIAAFKVEMDLCHQIEMGQIARKALKESKETT